MFGTMQQKALLVASQYLVLPPGEKRYNFQKTHVVKGMALELANSKQTLELIKDL